MGFSVTSPLSPWKNGLKKAALGRIDEIDAIIVRSTSFKVKTALSSVSFKKRNYENILTTDGSGRRVIEESLSFKNWEPEKINLETTTSFENQNMGKDKLESPIIRKAREKHGALLSLKPPRCFLEQISPRPKSELDAAAVKVQKVYKSYRTRRNLADCAVVVEELWWKALDFAALNQSSVSFFNIEKPETAVSRWARARTRAAKVGKGLSKDEKAQKLALQHWLEAVGCRRWQRSNC